MNKKIRRWTTRLLIISIVIMSLTGCGNGSTGTEAVTKTTLSKGQIITFGCYEQDGDIDNGKEPIKWQVLDVDDGKALLVSNNIIDSVEYNESTGIYGNEETESSPWSSSYIFEWLNNDFMTTAFSSEEISLIQDTTDYSLSNPEIIGSVFLLSYEEIQKYYNLKTVTLTNYYNKSEYQCSFANELLCEPTEYALSKKIDSGELTEDSIKILTDEGFEIDSTYAGKTYAGYWLRSSLNWDSWFTAEGHALIVQQDGTIELDVASLDNMKTNENGIRPCVWINTDGADKYVTIENIEN